MINKKMTQAVKELLKEAIEGKHKDHGICFILNRFGITVDCELKRETYFKEAHGDESYFILGDVEFDRCLNKEDFWSGEGGELRRKWCSQVIEDINTGKFGVVDGNCFDDYFLTLLK